jgi:asparagine synthase (glutamine-hydrolysing)
MVSGIAGVLNRDGRPANASVLERMLAAAPHRGPDGSSITVRGSIAMGYQRRNTTAEEAREIQPLCDDRGALLVIDGRVDECHGISVSRVRGSGPASVVVSAWREWGERCLPRLLGDFAFALWDPATETLLCGRDPLGVRPFYYADCGGVFVWGSDLRQVLAHPAVDAAPDEGFVAELLAFDMRSHTATLYRKVRRLPPAHGLAIDRRGVRLFRYWDLDGSRQIRYRSNGEYAEHFRALFDDAVACRLRASRPVAADLSGGLDSSSIVVVAADLARRGRAPLLTAASLVIRGRPEADEALYMKDVVRAAGVPWVRVELPRFDAGGWRESARARRDIPEFPSDVIGEGLRAALASRGFGVSLSGTGGDYALTGSFFHYADLLRRGRLLSLARRYVDVARSPSMGWTSAMFLRGGIWPLLPPPIKRILRDARGARRAVPAWIDRGFAERIALADRLRREPTPDRLPSVARYDIMQQYRSAVGLLGGEAYERASAEAGLEDRHPFYDRKLVEFMVALPDEQRWHGGQTKCVLRRAMNGLLPESVLRRTDKGEFSSLFLDAFAAIGGESFFRDLELVRRGWVDSGETLRLYRRLHGTIAAGYDVYTYSADMWPLWMIAALEMWVRANCEEIDAATGQAA